MAIELRDKNLKALVDPGRGVGVMAFAAEKDGRWLDLMPNGAASDLACASFLMMPYSNRIENGSFVFADQEYQLENGANHAIHGDVRTRPWKILGQDRGRLFCGFNSIEHQGVNWPWPFEAEVEYRLEGGAFVSELRLWNRGDNAMPAGFGWHPYFNRTLTQEGEPVLLCFKVEAAFPDAHDNRIPSGPAALLEESQDFRRERVLERDNFLDVCCTGYDGGGHIAWPQSGVRLGFRCSVACSHLVLYNPGDKPYFAVEPVTNANNGVNLHARGEADSGTVVLAPGKRLDAVFALEFSCC